MNITTEKVMKSIYYLALVLSLSLIATISQAQSLEGIQDMASEQNTALDLLADQTSVQEIELIQHLHRKL